jgi:DNA-binding transcriptional MerR regulator
MTLPQGESQNERNMRLASMPLHTIGDVARIAGVSTKAIRFWEERGLLTDIERTPSGYRIFREEDLLTIRFI